MTLKNFLLAFVPLFVATDPIALIPFFFSACAERDAQARRHILTSAIVTALIVGVIFLFVGKGLLALIGVTVQDFQVAGGLLLLVLSIKEITGGQDVFSTASGPMMGSGAVPLGVPLIVGPAVVTSLIILTDQFGWLPCLAAFVANIAVVAIVFWQGERLMKFLGPAVIAAASKVAGLLLAAYGVMMMRLGIMAIWKH